jgi:hypothetical protein
MDRLQHEHVRKPLLNQWNEQIALFFYLHVLQAGAVSNLIRNLATYGVMAEITA